MRLKARLKTLWQGDSFYQFSPGFREQEMVFEAGAPIRWGLAPTFPPQPGNAEVWCREPDGLQLSTSVSICDA